MSTELNNIETNAERAREYLAKGKTLKEVSLIMYMTQKAIKQALNRVCEKCKRETTGAMGIHVCDALPVLNGTHVKYQPNADGKLERVETEIKDGKPIAPKSHGEILKDIQRETRKEAGKKAWATRRQDERRQQWKKHKSTIPPEAMKSLKRLGLSLADVGQTEPAAQTAERAKPVKNRTVTPWETKRGPMSAEERMSIQSAAKNGMSHEHIARSVKRSLQAVQDAINYTSNGGNTKGRIYAELQTVYTPVSIPPEPKKPDVVIGVDIMAKTPVKFSEANGDFHHKDGCWTTAENVKLIRAWKEPIDKLYQSLTMSPKHIREIIKHYMVEIPAQVVAEPKQLIPATVPPLEKPVGITPDREWLAELVKANSNLCLISTKDGLCVKHHSKVG